MSAQFFCFVYIFELLKTGQERTLFSGTISLENLRELSNDYIKSGPKIKQRLSNDYQNRAKSQLVEI